MKVTQYLHPVWDCPMCGALYKTRRLATACRDEHLRRATSGFYGRVFG